jgi:hypothetical protein
MLIRELPLNGIEPEKKDDIQRELLGPRGVPGAPDPAKMTPQREEDAKTSRPARSSIGGNRPSCGPWSGQPAHSASMDREHDLSQHLTFGEALTCLFGAARG